MWWIAAPPLLVLLIGAALQPTSKFGAEAVELAEILRTPQFMLISQFRCETVYEFNVADQKCPIGLTAAQNKQSSCHTDVRAHLIRDPTSAHNPRILYVLGNHINKPLILIEEIVWPITFNRTHGFYSRTMEITPNSATIALPKLYKMDDVTATLYDSNQQLLYVLNRGHHVGRDSPMCTVFFINNVFPPGTPSAEQVADFPLHRENSPRFEWVIDHYENKAYYTTRQGETTVLHSVPTDRLFSVFKEGTSGTVVHAFQNELRSHFRVSGGALFTYVLKDNIQMAYIRALHHKEDGGIVCNIHSNSTRLPPVISTLVVRDTDFCLVRDGRIRDVKFCTDERINWLADHGLIENPMGSGTISLILLVISICLAVLVLLLCCCLCWMKKNLDSSYIDEPPRPVPYYPTAPGQYPDMDVSVDKWNTNY